MAKFIPLRPLAHPQATHVVAQALQAVGYDLSDLPRFLKQVQHVDFGLTAEYEFAAVAAWLGRCRLIHPLDQTRMCSPGMERTLGVPDLIAVVERSGLQRPFLIEVKTTGPATDSQRIRLPAKKKYIESIQRYSEATGIPWLIAWRPRDFSWWILFDPLTTPYDNYHQAFSLVDAAMNDLMGTLFGDFSVTPEVGVGIMIEREIVGPKVPSCDGFTVETVVTDAYWRDSQGQRQENVPPGIWLAVVATGEASHVEQNGTIVSCFLAREESTKAQTILKLMAAYGMAEEERVHWLHITQELDRLPTCDQLTKDLEGYFGSFIRYVVHFHPQRWPASVPAEWRGP